MMSTKRDYYDILGVAKGASADEIKKMYRKLVMQHHPDRVSAEQKKEAEEKFKEISEAYAVLSDSQKRSLYDQYGHAGIDSRFSTEDIFRNADFGSIFKDFGGQGGFFEDIFSDLGFNLFGGRSSRSHRGDDLHYEYAITLEEAARGVTKSVNFSRFDRCGACGGSGAQPGSQKGRCSMCQGRGTVTSGLGFISFSQTCPTCQGAGTVITAKCTKCRGSGRQRVEKSVEVNIPAGVATGSALRLRNEGHFNHGGYGDLYLHLEVKRHSLFERINNDIKYNVTISMSRAALGSEIEVPTLNGSVTMKIPAGTQPNTIFRLKGKGMVDLRTKRTGDQLVEVRVDIPKKLSAKERNLLEEFARLKREH